MGSVHYKLISIVWSVTIYHLITPPFAWKRIAHKQPNGLAEKQRGLALLACGRVARFQRIGVILPDPRYFLTAGQPHQCDNFLNWLCTIKQDTSRLCGGKSFALCKHKMPKSFLVKNKKGRPTVSSSLSGHEVDLATEEHGSGEITYLCYCFLRPRKFCESHLERSVARHRYKSPTLRRALSYRRPLRTNSRKNNGFFLGVCFRAGCWEFVYALCWLFVRDC